MSKLEVYKKIKLLGEGSFGKAYLVQCESDKSLAVIKQIDLEFMSEKERTNAFNEAIIMEKLIHPFIIKFREIYKTKKGLLCIVMDYAEGIFNLGGDLGKIIDDKTNLFIPEDQIFEWVCQICLALKYLHDRKIIHRDLKAQNIFLTKNKTVKLADFGISKVLDFTKQKAQTMVGTPYYLSPEIIKSEGYSYESDVWSLGVIIYELCMRKHPFEATNLNALVLKIIDGKFEPITSPYSSQMKDLINKLLQVNPAKRPRVQEILKWEVFTSKIQKLLSESEYEDEFSHTVLHKINIFSKNEKNMTENSSLKKAYELKERKEAKNQTTKMINKSKLNLNSETKESKQSKKHSELKNIREKAQIFEVDSTLTAKKLTDLQKNEKRQIEDMKKGTNNIHKVQEKEETQPIEDAKEIAKNKVDKNKIEKEKEFLQIIKDFTSLTDSNELANSIILQEKQNYAERSQARNEMKSIISINEPTNTSLFNLELSSIKIREDREDSNIQDPSPQANIYSQSLSFSIEDLINFVENSIGKEKYLKCLEIIKNLDIAFEGVFIEEYYLEGLQQALTEKEAKEFLNVFMTLLAINKKVNKK